MEAFGFSVDGSGENKDLIMNAPGTAALVDDSGTSKDLGKVSKPHADKSNVKNNGSSLATLEPFVYERRKRRTYKPHPTLSHFDSLFGAENWSRFLVLKSEDKIPSGILENRLLNACPSADMSFRLKRPNEWLVETTTKNQSQSILDIKEIEGIKVDVSRHDSLNYIQGTVVLPNIQEEEIPSNRVLLESLKLRYNNIHDIETYEITSRKDQNNKLKIMKIKFIGQSIPLKIKILGQNREVRPFVPKPLQCNKCFRYGHTYKRCTNKEVCAVCGSQHHITDWKCSHVKCVNCGLQHHAKSKTCEFYIYNTEIKILMSRTGMSAREAKLELKVRGLFDPAKCHSYRTNLYKPVEKNNKSDNKKEENKEITIANLATHNRFQDLEIQEAENSSQDIMRDEEINSKKRNLEKSPPKPKSINNKTVEAPSVKPKKTKFDLSKEVSEADPIVTDEKKTTNKCNEDGEISSSPIIGRSIVGRIQSLELKKTHDDLCGCHDCFINLCQQSKNITKDNLLNIIRNFKRCRRSETTDLKSHRQGCMCINHLTYYKESNKQHVDSILGKLKSIENKSTKNTPKVQNQTCTKTETSKEQNKYTSSYNKVNNKASTSVNHNNLTAII